MLAFLNIKFYELLTRFGLSSIISRMFLFALQYSPSCGAPAGFVNTNPPKGRLITDLWLLLRRDDATAVDAGRGIDTKLPILIRGMSVFEMVFSIVSDPELVFGFCSGDRALPSVFSDALLFRFGDILDWCDRLHHRWLDSFFFGAELRTSRSAQ
jgi:hypothetical protein